MKIVANHKSIWTTGKYAMLLLVTFPLRLALLLLIIIWARRA